MTIKNKPRKTSNTAQLLSIMYPSYEKEMNVRRALIALYLEVDESIAYDIETKVLELINELKKQHI
jgi:hypothetical protein